jgi:hypothetical protein
MNSVSTDIKDLLIANSLGTFGADLFIGKEPAEVNNCVTLFDYSNGTDGDLEGIPYYRDSLQIRGRDVSYQNGWEKLQAIKEFLNYKGNFELNGTHYSVIICTSGPEIIEYDKNNRARFSMNLNIQRRTI